MPELPEVETTRRGIEPHVLDFTVREVIIRRRDLRQPVSEDLSMIEGSRVIAVRRRSKYILLEMDGCGTILIHLGMSGSLRLVGPEVDWKKHDHLGMTMSSGLQLRYHDPRRFGLVLRIEGDPWQHSLLDKLGPEPLESELSGRYLKEVCARRKAPIKTVIMDAAVVVGVGNIYASEALFRAGIHPRAVACQLSLRRMEKLAESIRVVLTESIAQGGTTLRDFINAEGQPGYFSQRLNVYGQKGERCKICGAGIRQEVIGQRSTYWCPSCQRRDR